MARPSMIRKALASPYGRALLADPCAWCGQRCCTTLDHLEPVARGGDSRWENLVGVCARCNHARGAKSLLAMLAWTCGIAQQLREAQQQATLWAGVGR